MVGASVAKTMAALIALARLARNNGFLKLKLFSEIIKGAVRSRQCVCVWNFFAVRLLSDRGRVTFFTNEVSQSSDFDTFV